MAAVAICPQCNHELLVPDGTDNNAWAKCPSCQAFFQLPDATQRQIPVLLLLDQEAAGGSSTVAGYETPRPAVESALDEATADFASAKTISDLDISPRSKSEGTGPEHGDRSIATGRVDTSFPAAEMVTDATDEETREHDREWSAPFADTLPPPAAASPEDVPNEVKAGDTWPKAGASAPNDGPAESGIVDEAASGHARRTWDDAEQMEQLLASVEGRPLPKEATHRRRASEPRGARALANEALPQIAPRHDAPRRKRSPARLITGIALGGLGGSAVACYILLWALGPEGDVLDVARFIPGAILPASFQQAPAQLAADRSRPADDSAEVMAAYEAPAVDDTGRNPPATVDSNGDALVSSRREATDAAEFAPHDFDEPDAVPLAGEAAALRDAPSYSADALAAALEAARDAQPGLVQGSLNEEASQRTKAISYVTLCQLAEVLTFAHAESQPHEIEIMRQEAEQFFRETLVHPRTRSEVAIITTKWLDSPSRRQNGIFLAGTVSAQSVSGAMAEYQLDTEIGTTLTVLVPLASADVAVPNAPVAVIGSIIDQPAERFDGYAGSAWRAIWADKLIPLD